MFTTQMYLIIILYIFLIYYNLISFSSQCHQVKLNKIIQCVQITDTILHYNYACPRN